MLESNFELYIHKHFCGLIRVNEHSNYCEPCQIKVSQHSFSIYKKSNPKYGTLAALLRCMTGIRYALANRCHRRRPCIFFFTFYLYLSGTLSLSSFKFETNENHTQNLFAFYVEFCLPSLPNFIMLQSICVIQHFLEIIFMYFCHSIRLKYTRFFLKRNFTYANCN